MATAGCSVPARLSRAGEKHWVSMITGVIWPADLGWQDPEFSSSFVFSVHIWQARGPSADHKCICCCAASQPEPRVLWWGKSKVWETAGFPTCHNAKGLFRIPLFPGLGEIWVKISAALCLSRRAQQSQSLCQFLMSVCFLLSLLSRFVHSNHTPPLICNVANVMKMLGDI